MEQYKVIEIKESVFADNNREADRIRESLKQEKTFLLNLMSSPGSGKTSTLQQRCQHRRSRQHGARVLDGDADLLSAPQEDSQRRAPQQGRRDGGFQLPPEGTEEADIGPRLVPPDAVDGGVVQRGGCRADGDHRKAAKEPADAQHHDIQDAAAPAPEQCVRIEEITHFPAGQAPASPARRPDWRGPCRSGA